MPKERADVQRELNGLKRDLPAYEAALAKARKDKDQSGTVNYSMAVAGIKNSIKQLEAKLEEM